MSLIAELEDELKEATLAREAERRDALRLILASLRSAEKELQRPLSEDEELQVLQRERKPGVPLWLWTVAGGVVLALAIAFLYALSWGVARLARATGATPRSDGLAGAARFARQGSTASV